MAIKIIIKLIYCALQDKIERKTLHQAKKRLYCIFRKQKANFSRFLQLYSYFSAGLTG
jgi:hypothetical protein